jgi:hypothetical protein
MSNKDATAFGHLVIAIKRANLAFERGDVDLGADYVRDAQAFIEGFERTAYSPTRTQLEGVR